MKKGSINGSKMTVSTITSSMRTILKEEGEASPKLIPLQKQLISALIRQCEQLNETVHRQAAFINGVAGIKINKPGKETTITIEYPDLNEIISKQIESTYFD